MSGNWPEVLKSHPCPNCGKLRKDHVETYLGPRCLPENLKSEIAASSPPQHPEPSMYGPPGTTAGKT